jgi:hypothetical protein
MLSLLLLGLWSVPPWLVVAIGENSWPGERSTTGP